MKTIASLSLLLLPVVLAHGEHGKPADGDASYAQRHVSHISRSIPKSHTDNVGIDGYGTSHVK